MTTGAAIVIALRILVPLLIFKKNLTGGIIAMLLDGADVILIDFLKMGGFSGHYHQIDKVLDTYYLSIEAWIAFGWRNQYERLPALLLFGFRIVGVVLFELTERRIVLFLFPNMFENWWLYIVAVRRWKPSWTPHSWIGVAVPMGVLLVPKMGQEYLLHFAEAQPWNWFKKHVFDP
ncbi:MAG: hypothetical protein IPN07_17155 [Dehalococcoidia bacterium]|nr:hypothetical protein [Dehalococcoidia bacterium]